LESHLNLWGIGYRKITPVGVVIEYPPEDGKKSYGPIEGERIHESMTPKS
jgi:hypothetical protein